MKVESFFKYLLITTLILTAIQVMNPVHAVPATDWSNTFGGAGDDEGFSVTQTSDGGYIITGCTTSIGAGGYDVSLIKTDASGNEAWTKTFGGAGEDCGYCVLQTSDGGYIVAGYTNSFGAGASDVYLIKTDASGNEAWSKTFGGAWDEYSRCVLQTGDGGYVIVGTTNSIGAGSNDVYLIKTDTNGNEVWSKTYGGINNDGGYCVSATSDGGYIISGYTYSFTAGNNDVYLVKTDANGNELWSNNFGGGWHEAGYCVTQTSDGGYIVTGFVESFGAGNEDFYLIKTNSNGNEAWSKTFGGIDDEYGYWVIQTSDGGYLISGYTESYGAGNQDVYIVKTDSTGNMDWSNTYGGANDDSGQSIVQTGDGSYIITGYTASLGAGSYDFYLIKLEAPAPAPSSSTHKPNPGVVYIDNHVDFSNCVHFYFSLRDMNKTEAANCFTVTITDSDGTVVFSRVCNIRNRHNWYSFYLCSDRFSAGSFDVYASGGNWSQETEFKIN